MPGANMAQRTEYRYEQLPGWITSRPSGQPFTEFWMRFQDGRPADTLSLPTLVDAAAPVVLELGEWLSSIGDEAVLLQAQNHVERMHSREPLPRFDGGT